MAQAMPFISVAMSVIGAIQQFSAAGDAEDIARQNAANQRLETEEQGRRQKKADDLKLSEQLARASASGLAGGGSQGGYMDAMAEEMGKEQRWLATSGENKANIMEDEGALTASQGKSAAFGSLAGAAKSAYGYWGS